MDWKTLLSQLRERGWTQSLIADRIGGSQATVSDLNKGKTVNPSYSIGSALIALHASGELPAEESSSPEPKAA